MAPTLVTKAAVEYNSTTPFGYAFADASGVGTGPFAAAHATIDGATGALVSPATSSGQASALIVLQAIEAAVQNTRTETIWTDDTGTYFVRVDNGGTLSWLTPAGAASSAPGVGARPVAGPSIIVDRASYQATGAGTGFTTNDYLDHFVTADPATGAVIANFWLNSTQNTAIAAPSAALIAPISPLATGAAKDTSLQSIITALAATLKSATQSNAPRVSTTGSLAAVSAVLTIAVDGMSTGSLQILGTWVGTIAFYGSIDGGTTFFAMNVSPLGGSGGASVASVTTNGQFEFSTSGLTHVQAQMPAYTSGSATVLLAAANGGKIVRVRAPATDPLPVADVIAEVGIGTPADTAAASGANGSIIAQLKGIFVKLSGSIAVTGTFYQATQPVSIAAGADVTTGTQADAAATGTSITTGAFSVVALLKGIYNACVGSTPAGTAIIGKVGIDQTTQGTTNGVAVLSTVNATEGTTIDAPLAVAASSTASSLNAALKGLFNLFFNGTARIQAALWWTEAIATSVAASGVFSGTIRSSGATTGSGSPYGYFTAQVYSTQAGTLAIYDQAGSGLGTSTPVAANAGTTLKIPALGSSYQSVFTNGSASTAATVTLKDGFTAS